MTVYNLYQHNEYSVDSSGIYALEHKHKLSLMLERTYSLQIWEGALVHTKTRSIIDM